jgi:phosphomannomutase
VRVRVLPQPLPTPLTAFAVLHYGAAAGVMVTASHNPAADNGYKVYASDGAQIVPPDDELIAAAAAGGAPPVASGAPAPAAPGGTAGGAPPGPVSAVDRAELLDAYASAALAVLDPGGPRELVIVYTPLHGVGGEVLPWLLERAGFAPPHVVAAQAGPDPDFPTAPFPNPEEPGVLDLALAEAARIGADVVIANDPDADRLAVAVPGRPPPASGAGWRVLSGDELGALLGSALVDRRSGHVGPAVPVVASSIVSSSLLARIAAGAGVRYVETLTGFKWIARAADSVPSGTLLFGYEEALGYAVSTSVRDKDGLSAALLLAELAARARAAGRPLLAALDDLDRRFGVHLTSQWSLRLSGPAAHERLLAAVEGWRARPPAVLGGLGVVELVDLEHGATGLPPTAGMMLRLAAAEPAGAAGGDPPAPRGVSGRVVVRPSGTEPKLKAYLEVVLPRPSAARPDAALEDDRRLAGLVMQRLRAEVAASLAP